MSDLRKLFAYNVVLANEQGGAETVTFTTYWSPQRVELSEVANAAAAQFSAERGTRLLPVSATLAN